MCTEHRRIGESTDVPGMRFAQGNLGVPEFLISTDPGECFKTRFSKSVCVAVPSWGKNTLPKALKLIFSAPANGPSRKEIHLPTIGFQGYVSFRDGNLSTLNVFLKMIFLFPFGGI